MYDSRTEDDSEADEEDDGGGSDGEEEDEEEPHFECDKSDKEHVHDVSGHRDIRTEIFPFF